MISSEIANKYAPRGLSPNRGIKKSRPRSNPQLLQAGDSIVLSGGGSFDSGRNSGSGVVVAQFKSTNDNTMRPLGSDRNPSNSGNGSQVSTRSSVAKYANPPAVEFQGQMWAIS